MNFTRLTKTTWIKISLFCALCFISLPTWSSSWITIYDAHHCAKLEITNGDLGKGKKVLQLGNFEYVLKLRRVEGGGYDLWLGQILKTIRSNPGLMTNNLSISFKDGLDSPHGANSYERHPGNNGFYKMFMYGKGSFKERYLKPIFYVNKNGELLQRNKAYSVNLFDQEGESEITALLTANEKLTEFLAEHPNLAEFKQHVVLDDFFKTENNKIMRQTHVKSPTDWSFNMKTKSTIEFAQHGDLNAYGAYGNDKNFPSLKELGGLVYGLILSHAAGFGYADIKSGNILKLNDRILALSDIGFISTMHNADGAAHQNTILSIQAPQNFQVDYGAGTQMFKVLPTDKPNIIIYKSDIFSLCLSILSLFTTPETHDQIYKEHYTCCEDITNLQIQVMECLYNKAQAAINGAYLFPSEKNEKENLLRVLKVCLDIGQQIQNESGELKFSSYKNSPVFYMGKLFNAFIPYPDSKDEELLSAYVNCSQNTIYVKIQQWRDEILKKFPATLDNWGIMQTINTNKIKWIVEKQAKGNETKDIIPYNDVYVDVYVRMLEERLDEIIQAQNYVDNLIYRHGSISVDHLEQLKDEHKGNQDAIAIIDEYIRSIFTPRPISAPGIGQGNGDVMSSNDDLTIANLEKLSSLST